MLTKDCLFLLAVVSNAWMFLHFKDGRGIILQKDLEY